MNARTEERVGGWDSRTFSRGHAGLRDLADEEFSGVVVSDGGAWLSMLNGKVVGVFEGSIADFEDAAGTARVAPDPALPLLFAMEELGGTLEEQYYTKDTPISEADDTLTSGGFTGYVELSENVLSGDYYVCYYGGRSMPVAFVGNSERLMTGDEAFERADDEVGIYDVYSVEVDVVEVPDPDTGGEAVAGGGTDPGGGSRTDDGGSGGRSRGTDRSGAADRGADPTDDRTRDRPRADSRGGDPGRSDERGRGRARSDDRDRTSAGGRGGEPARTDDGGSDRGRTDERGDDRRPDDRGRDRTGTASRRGESGTLDDDSLLGDLSEQLQEVERRDAGLDDAADGSDTGSGDAGGDRPDEAAGQGGGRGGSSGDPLAGGPAGTGSTGDRSRNGGAADDPQARDGSGSDPSSGDRSGYAGGRRDRDPADDAGGREGSGDDPTAPAGGEDRRDRRGTDDPSRRDPGGRDARDDRPTGDAGGDRDRSGPGRRDHGGDDPGRPDSPREGRTGDDRGGTGPARRDPAEGSPDADRAEAGSTPDDDPRGGPGDRPRDRPDRRSDPPRSDPDGGRSRPAGGSGDGAQRRRFEDEAAWREERSVPSITPGEERGELVEELREGLREREAEIDRLRDRVATLEDDRDAGESDRERLQGEIADLNDDLGELRRTVLRLDEAIDRLESGTAAGGASAGAGGGSAGADASGAAGAAGAAAGGPELTPDQALAGTKLLVRYGSQGKPTLKTAHGGGADRQAVNDNLRLDVHTDFPEGATVDGRPFDEFLASRMEYGFVEWLVRELPFEIRETGNDSALQDLYDAIPRIDRVELAGEVTIEYLNDEDREPERIEFDVVARDDREQPLVVANFDDSGDPATQGMVVELNDRAGGVREAGPLNAAFLVTSSYFDGEARDTASEATSGSFLSRDSRKSFVNVSRKRGYHLCLVESRGGDFHVRVPEL